MNAPSHIGFRLATLLLAILLCIQCVWLLLAEIPRLEIAKLSTSAPAAIAATQQHNAAAWAALIGAFRGDLWAESAFTYAYLLVGENVGGKTAELTQKLARAQLDLEHALNDAPAQPDAWLFRAGLALRYPLLGFNATDALKMSYYTGPSEQDLIPTRLRIAARMDVFSDTELSLFVSRDLRLLLAQKQNSAVTEAYNAASSPGKRFIEQTVGQIDPSALKLLGASEPKQLPPD